VVRLTDAAAERIKAVMAKAESRIAAVRVGVKNGGCAGMAYTMEYADKINPLDEVVEDKGVRILIDPKAVLFLLGTEMDYKVDKLRRSSFSTIRTRPQPAAAANRCSSSRRAAKPPPYTNRKDTSESPKKAARIARGQR
jgi:iron-sulfur cluster assembly accessory protein